MFSCSAKCLAINCLQIPLPTDVNSSAPTTYEKRKKYLLCLAFCDTLCADANIRSRSNRRQTWQYFEDALSRLVALYNSLQTWIQAQKSP